MKKEKIFISMNLINSNKYEAYLFYVCFFAHKMVLSYINHIFLRLVYKKYGIPFEILYCRIMPLYCIKFHFFCT